MVIEEELIVRIAIGIIGASGVAFVSWVLRTPLVKFLSAVVELPNRIYAWVLAFGMFIAWIYFTLAGIEVGTAYMIIMGIVVSFAALSAFSSNHRDGKE